MDFEGTPVFLITKGKLAAHPHTFGFTGRDFIAYSMQDAGILPDDILIVNGKREAKDGDIVVAAMNGENTVKRLRRSPNSLVLQPENPDFRPIPVTAEDDFSIQGVVVGVMRSYR